MEISKHIHTTLGEIYLWKAENYSERIAAGEKKRIIERMEVRAKLDGLGVSNEILYKENGQPYLKDLPNVFISISHSNGVLAVYIANQAVGIDIEFERASMFEGRHYFVNEQEEKIDLSQETLQLIWGAKEAFYKKMEGQIADLKNEVTISIIRTEEEKIGVLYASASMELKFHCWDDLYLVYTI